MKNKALLLFLCAVILLVSAAACTSQQQKEPEKTADTDATTTASIVKDEAGFIKAISKDGTWIIATLNDIETDRELVVEGEFHDKGKPENDLYRKIALYTQDENRNVTNRFTLTAPKMTVRSPNTKISNGTFAGDIYVESNGFTLENAKVEGNIFFANQEYKDSFQSENSEVTGKTEIQQ